MKGESDRVSLIHRPIVSENAKFSGSPFLVWQLLGQKKGSLKLQFLQRLSLGLFNPVVMLCDNVVKGAENACDDVI